MFQTLMDNVCQTLSCDNKTMCRGYSGCVPVLGEYFYLESHYVVINRLTKGNKKNKHNKNKKQSRYMRNLWSRHEVY